MGNKAGRARKAKLRRAETEMVEDGPEEPIAIQYMKPEMTESYFGKTTFSIEIAEELQRVSEKVNVTDFKILKVLGRGTFGKVVLVQHKEDMTLYALKTLRKTKIIKLLQVEHTKSERTILEKIEHPFIISLKYAFQTRAKLYIVFEFICGGDLFQHLTIVDYFPEERARFYAAEILLALEFLHTRKVVYRDLKPENVLIDTDGHIKLTDFGLAKELSGLDSVENTTTKTFCGTDEFMAPEIILRHPYGESVDWWALGILLYEMLTGWPPFEDENRKTLFDRILTESPDLGHENISVEARDLLSRMLEKRIDKRITLREMKKHPFFASINFDKLYAKELPPPFKPVLKSADDDTYFDPNIVKEDPLKESPTGHLSSSKSKKESYFKNFSFSPNLTQVSEEAKTEAPN